MGTGKSLVCAREQTAEKPLFCPTFFVMPAHTPGKSYASTYLENSVEVTFSPSQVPNIYVDTPGKEYGRQTRHSVAATNDFAGCEMNAEWVGKRRLISLFWQPDFRGPMEG